MTDGPPHLHGGHRTSKTAGRPRAWQDGPAGMSHRWLLGVGQVVESGWRDSGRRVRLRKAEDVLSAVAVLAPVSIDVSDTRSSSGELTINAFAVLRDIDIAIAKGDRVELSGRSPDNPHLINLVPEVARDHMDRVIWIHGRTFRGDITVRLAKQK